jgi:hypothetical protein
MQVLVIILGAFIMLAVGALLAGLYFKVNAKPAENAAATAAKPPFFNDLHIDTRSEIVDARLDGDKLLIRLKNDYGQQLVILDARDGHEIGRVGVALQYNDSP